MSRADASSLFSLRVAWEGSYDVALSADGVWSAAPLSDPAAVITADTPYELRTLLQDDFSERAVKARGDGGGSC